MRHNSKVRIGFILFTAVVCLQWAEMCWQILGTGSDYVFIFVTRIFFSKYVILFDWTSICLVHFIFTGFGKSVLHLCRFLCWQFGIDFFSEVYLFVCLYTCCRQNINSSQVLREVAHCCTVLILLYYEYIILVLSALCNLVF